MNIYNLFSPHRVLLWGRHPRTGRDLDRPVQDDVHVRWRNNREIQVYKYVSNY